MKRILKYSILCAILVVLAFLYAHIDKKVEIYNRDIDNSDYILTGELIGGTTVDQQFLCTQDTLDGINIMCSSYGDTTGSVYTYQILDADGEKVLREGTLDAGTVASGKYTTLSFEQMTGCRDKTYLFRFMPVGVESGRSIGFYTVPDSGDEQPLDIMTTHWNPNVLAMRTVSSMFDIETFIVAFLCGVYLYLFLKMLFRFFT